MKDNKLTPVINGHVSGAHGPASSQKEDAGAMGIDVGEILDMLRRGKWIVVVTAIVVTAIVSGYTYTLDPIYEAESIVKIDLGSQSSEGMMMFGQERDLSSEVGVLEFSAELANRVIDELRDTEEALEAKGRFTLLYNEDGQPLPTHEVMEALAEATTFMPMPSQSMIRLRVESKVPEEASTIANVYMQEYEDFSREKARASVIAAREFLEKQADKRQNEIEQLDRQWAAFATNNEVITQGAGGELLVEEYTGLIARRDGIQFEIEQEQEGLRILRDQLAQFEPSLRENVQQEQVASGLRSEIRMLEERIGMLKADAAQYYVANEDLEGDRERIRRDFPELSDILDRVDGLEKRKREITNQLVAEVSASGSLPVMGTVSPSGDEAAGAPAGALGRVSELRSRITQQELTIGQLEAQVQGLNRTIATYEPRLSRIPQQTIQREQLERKMGQAEEFFSSIAEELQQTIIAEESELGYVENVRRAFVPTFPVRPNIKQNIVLGFLLGIGFGVGLAFLKHASSSEINRPDDLLRHGYKVTGIIPDMNDEIEKEFRGKETVEIEGHTLSTRLLPILSPWSPVTENYRLIRTNLKYSGRGAAQGEPPATILITSPEPGDGKTTTAVNLALTFVLSGKKVLLIDADMRRPSGHKVLGLERGPGLAEMLRGDGKMQIVRRTYIDGLYFVPAGHAEDPPTEALDSDRMRKLIELGNERCDVVIIDTPPVLAASDPLVLAPFADSTLVVTSAEGTDLASLDLARDMLEGVGVAIDGIIFNRFDDKAAGSSKYRYRYYRDDEYKLVS